MEDQFEDILKRLDKNELTGWLRAYAEKDEKVQKLFSCKVQ